ncbi:MULTISPECIES: CDP-alcohol phosphatidyltransferase family protein [unclassified Halomonas]|uniref:CDP-alcohol phosphatidyltransferase family protein n=1 Tax=unclassified Halomonas TaxID=2609666 RepID=UPI0031B801C1
MLDRFTMPLTQRPLLALADILHRQKITADQVTLAAFIVGLSALPLLAFEQYGWALAAIVLNRVGDGVDGALARLNNQQSDAGGFLARISHRV